VDDSDDLERLLQVKHDDRVKVIAAAERATGQNALALSRLTERDLRSAIEHPARLSGVSFESALVDRSVGEFDELPELQLLLERLWHQRAGQLRGLRGG